MPDSHLFMCDNPDFTVRSVLDGDVFNVRKERLTSGSEVFRDMFSCCDDGFSIVNTLDEENKTLELHEPAVALDALFYLLHAPPAPYVAPPPPPAEDAEPRDYTRVWQGAVPAAATIIPWPLLPALFVLADKYALAPAILDVLTSHLAAYTSVFPLEVYGTAVGLGLADIAADASAFLLHPPLGTYAPEEIRVIPTAEAYHRLVLLHDFRVKRLAEVLRDEEIFPHGYGQCAWHSQRARSVWEKRKQAVFAKIEAATDIAAAMEPAADELADCQTCKRACRAAIAMLAYKCAKIPRRVDKVEPDW